MMRNRLEKDLIVAYLALVALLVTVVLVILNS